MHLRFILSISFILCFSFAADIDETIIFPDRPEFRSDKIITLPDGTAFHLDIRSREAAAVLPDGEIRFTGGFGNGYGHFMEPVDITSDGVSVFVCDRAGNAIIQLTRRLEVVKAFSFNQSGFSEPIFPSSVSASQNGYVAVLSEDRRLVLVKQPQEDLWTIVADLDRQPVSIPCPETVRFTSLHSIVITSSCSKTEYTFSLFGRLLSARLITGGD